MDTDKVLMPEYYNPETGETMQLFSDEDGMFDVEGIINALPERLREDARLLVEEMFGGKGSDD